MARWRASWSTPSRPRCAAERRHGHPLSAAGAPFAALSPDAVLGALDSVGLRGDGRLLQLNSYENRVYQVYLEDGRIVVAKFYRPERWSDAQLREEHAFAQALAGDEIPVAAPLPLAGGDTLAVGDIGGVPLRLAVALRVPGRAPEIDDLDVLERIGSYLGRIHVRGSAQPFGHRLTLDVATFGQAARDALTASDAVPPDAAGAWREIVDAALVRIGAAFAAQPVRAMLRLHGDCHLGNILWSPAGPCFVDLDDAVNGPPIQDLWMLLAGDRPTMTRQLGAVLDGYERFRAFDRRELALIEPLRTLRMIHHSAWIARRWHDPAFPIAFPFFQSPAYWAQETTRLREQLTAMDEPALAA